MARKTHKIAEIESVIQYAENNGWTFKKPGKSAHAWGIIRCPFNDKDCRCGDYCQLSVWGTPKNPQNYAKKLRRQIDGCLYNKSSKE